LDTDTRLSDAAGRFLRAIIDRIHRLDDLSNRGHLLLHIQQGLLRAFEHVRDGCRQAVEDLRSSVGEVCPLFDRLRPLLRGHDRGVGRILNVEHQGVDTFGRLLALISKLADLGRHHGEPFAMFAGARRLHGRI
jgi:hypothetical protein